MLEYIKYYKDCLITNALYEEEFNKIRGLLEEKSLTDTDMLEYNILAVDRKLCYYKYLISRLLHKNIRSMSSTNPEIEWYIRGVTSYNLKKYLKTFLSLSIEELRTMYYTRGDVCDDFGTPLNGFEVIKGSALNVDGEETEFLFSMRNYFVSENELEDVDVVLNKIKKYV